MESNLKKLIQENKFAFKLRTEFVIDKDAYSALCRSLRELKTIWKDKDEIDKELMQELYIIPAIVRGQAEREEYGKETQDELVDMYLELDNLILECLS